MKKILLIGLICFILLCACNQTELVRETQEATLNCMDFSGNWLGTLTASFEQGDERIEFPIDYALEIEQDVCSAMARMPLNSDLQPGNCTMLDNQITCAYDPTGDCVNHLELVLNGDQLNGTLSNCMEENQPVTLARSTEADIALVVQDTEDALNTPIMEDEGRCTVASEFKPDWEEFFCDEFLNNHNGWKLGDTESDLSNFTVQINEGKLVLESTGKATSGYQSGVLQWLPSFNNPFTHDFMVQLSGKIDSDYKGSAWGIAFDGTMVTGSNSFYFFEITNAGTYSIGKLENNKLSTVQSTRENNAIKVGEENTITIVGDGGTYDFYVNGVLLTSQDLKPFDEANLMIVTSINEGVTARIEIDDILVRRGPWE